MEKTADIELKQLKTAMAYLAGLLEEGSLVAQCAQRDRIILAQTLDQMLEKVAGLPAETPDHLVRAVALRALISAQEQAAQPATNTDLGQRHSQSRMREAEVTATLQGHQLGSWETAEGDFEFAAKCIFCEGFVYVSPDTTYNLLSETCSRL